MSLRNVRLLQLLGLVVAIVGLTGFWVTRDVPRAILDDDTRAVLGLAQGEFQASFVVAGRDYDHVQEASPCRWVGGVCHRDRVGRFVYGQRTDTVLYVNIVGNKVNIVAMPRDLYLPQWQTRINAMYHYQGAEGVKRAVADILKVPVDYYAIINIDIFKELVDAIGGVDVNVPDRMYYRDAAAGLTIDLHPGRQRLDGEGAAGFVRYRQTARGDYDRIDRVKTLAYAMLQRLRDLNVRAVGLLPSLVETMFDEIETNASPALALQLLPRLPKLEIQAATLPTNTPEGSGSETYSARQVEEFLATMMGGRAREFAEVPESAILVTNKSGIPGLELDVKSRLVSLGVPEDRIALREGVSDPAPTRVLATTNHWLDATYYASLFHVGQQQIDRLPTVGGNRVGVELVLGEDAANFPSARALATRGE